MKCFYCNKIIRGDLYMGYDHQFCCDSHRWNYITNKEKIDKVAEYHYSNQIGYDYNNDIVDSNHLNINVKEINNTQKYNIICIPFLNRFLNGIFN